jgi:membrane protein implicated in regulation of membrane protease activity
VRDWSIWLIVAAALAVAEMFSLDLVLVMLAVGALAAAGTAVFTDTLALQAGVFAIVSVLGLVAIRPLAQRHMTSGPGIKTGVEALEGSPAIVLATVDQHQGRVKIGGEEWTARVYDSTQVLEPGDAVKVIEIKGATALVWKEE